MKRLLIICLTLVAATAWAMSPEDMAASLNEPQSLVLKTLPALSGKAVGISNGQLIFRSERGGGTLDYQYALDQIERLQFPGNDIAFASNELLNAGRINEALPLMRAIYEQRKHFLPLLTTGELPRLLLRARHRRVRRIRKRGRGEHSPSGNGRTRPCLA